MAEGPLGRLDHQPLARHEGPRLVGQFEESRGLFGDPLDLRRRTELGDDLPPHAQTERAEQFGFTARRYRGCSGCHTSLRVCLLVAGWHVGVRFALTAEIGPW